jgi:hypothetical protein
MFTFSGDFARAVSSGAGEVEEITVTEVPVTQRPPMLDVYAERYGKVSDLAAVLRTLPDPADHPTFRIQSATSKP